MSNLKISEMAEAESLNDNDLLTIVQSGINKKITKQNAIGDIIQAINNPTYTTTEGTDLTINNTRVGKMKLEYYGDMEQQTYTGVNKIGTLTDFVANDTSAINITYNTEANTITVKHLTTAAWKGIYKTLTGLTAGATMTISVYATTTTSTGWSLSVRNSGGTVIDETIRNTSGTETHFTFTVPNDGSITIRAYAGYGDVAVNDTATYSKFQLEYGSSVTAYEPYVGGMPSPNPSYPQEVKTVTGENTIDIVGRNLFNKANVTLGKRLTNMGQLYTDSDYYTSNYIQVKPSTTYTKNSPDEDGLHRACFYSDTDEASFISYVQTNTFTTPNNAQYLRFSGNQSELNTTQLEKGSTASTYEPYQSQSYELNLGKNLLPNIANPVTITGITFNINADKSVTVNGTATADVSLKITDYLTFKESNYILSGCPKNGNSTTYSMVLEGTGRDTGNGATFTSVTNKRVAIEIKNGVTVNNLVFKPMIEKGSQATSYAPYFEPIQLCEIAEHPDYIHDNGGKWFKHKEIERIIITSAVRASGGTIGTNAYYISTNVTNGVNDNAKALAWSNMFNPVAYNNRNGAPDCVLLQNGGVTLRTRNNTTLDWSDNTKRDAWLNANLPIVYYALATPTEEEITEPTLINQLNAIKYGAESYYGQTNIIITSEELQPILKVQTLDKIGD